MEKLNSKGKRSRITNIILKENKVGISNPPNFKSYFKATVVKTEI